jgi:hypothetical protein
MLLEGMAGLSCSDRASFQAFAAEFLAVDAKHPHAAGKAGRRKGTGAYSCEYAPVAFLFTLRDLSADGRAQLVPGFPNLGPKPSVDHRPFGSGDTLAPGGVLGVIVAPYE